MSEPVDRRSVRDVVALRAHGRCEYCCHPEAYSTDSFSIEHIIPKSRDGSDDIENLAYSCQGCNNFKYTRTDGIDPETGDVARLYNPRVDHWADHFQFGADYVHLSGLSPVGRATVSLLQLNRTGLVNLRWALYRLGLHPPDDLVGS